MLLQYNAIWTENLISENHKHVESTTRTDALNLSKVQTTHHIFSCTTRKYHNLLLCILFCSVVYMFPERIEKNKGNNQSILTSKEQKEIMPELEVVHRLFFFLLQRTVKLRITYFPTKEVLKFGEWILWIYFTTLSALIVRSSPIRHKRNHNFILYTPQKAIPTPSVCFSIGQRGNHRLVWDRWILDDSNPVEFLSYYSFKSHCQ